MVVCGAASTLMRFELFYQQSHYDTILPANDQPSIDPPSLSSEEHWMALLTKTYLPI